MNEREKREERYTPTYHKLEIGEEGTEAKMIIPTLTSWSRLHRTERHQAVNGRRKDLQT